MATKKNNVSMTFDMLFLDRYIKWSSKQGVTKSQLAQYKDPIFCNHKHYRDNIIECFNDLFECKLDTNDISSINFQNDSLGDLDITVTLNNSTQHIIHTWFASSEDEDLFYIEPVL